MQIEQETDYIVVRDIRSELVDRLARIIAEHETLTTKHTSAEVAALLGQVLPDERNGMPEMIGICDRRLEVLRGDRNEWAPLGKPN